MPRHTLRAGARRLVAPGLFATLLLLLTSVAFAQELAPGFPAVDGWINTSVRVGGTLYVGGAFHRVGTSGGGFVALDHATAEVVSPFPTVGGYVNDIESDGAGGWFLAGWFSRVNGEPRQNLAHVLADGTLSPWSPVADDEVMKLERLGGTLYVAGYFHSLSGQPRSNCGALDVATGEVMAFSPELDGAVRDVAIAAGRIAIVGDFENAGGSPQPGFALLDAGTGATVAAPRLLGYLESLTHEGTTVYVGGEFVVEGDPTHENLAGIDAASGLVAPWTPTVPGRVTSVAASNGMLYLAGSFSTLDAESRDGVGAYDLASGMPAAWSPAVPPGTYRVYAAPDRVYLNNTCIHPLSGQWTSVLAVDLAGNVLAWEPGTAGWLSDVLDDGTRVCLGGEMDAVGGVVRENLAAIDLATNSVLPWAPNVDNSVFAMAALGSTLYVSGSFAHVAGTPRNNLAALDLSTGALRDWAPDADQSVFALATSPGHVFAGGAFWTIGGRAATGVADLDPVSGLARDWTPAPNGTVFALHTTPDRVYVAGAFDHISGTPQSYLAAFDLASGEKLDWDPEVNGYVQAMADVPGGLAVGGQFTQEKGGAQPHLAVLRTSDAQLVPWAFPPDAPVSLLARENGALFVAGAFDSVGGQPRLGLAALDAANGKATDWNASRQDGVNTMQLHEGSLLLGGYFRTVNQQPAGALARIDDPLPTPALLELFRASADVVGVTLEWRVAPRSGLGLLAPQRSASAGTWEAVAGMAEPTNDGMRWVDRDVSPGDALEYRLAGTTANGSAWTSASLTVHVPTAVTRFSLAVPAPHPARDAALVRFGVPVRAHVRISLVDVQGRQVALLADADQEPGEHVSRLSLEGLPSGLYFLRMQAPGAELRQRLVVTR